MDPTELLHASMPLCRTLGIIGTEASADQVIAELGWQADLCTACGLLHGGTVMALADASGGACAFLNLPHGAVGTATIVIETELRVDDGTLVGKTTQTQTVLRPTSGDDRAGVAALP